MRWKGRRQSQNVEDRRRAGPTRRPRRSPFGRGFGGRRPAQKLSGRGIVVLLLIAGVIWLLGGNPLTLLQGGLSGGGLAPSPGPSASSAPIDPAEEELAAFVKTVLADTEDVWNKIFADSGQRYEEPTLVLFRGSVQSACGFASAATGPFYCPGDEQIYIDLSFYEQLSKQLGAPGDFAQAYVIAHEVGHHIQHLMGTTQRVHSQRGRISQAEYNDLSVRLELQADFLAGVWAHHADKAKDILEAGDIEEALNAAAAIGDDRLQKQAQGYVVPDSFTHGTSAQRVKWFRLGLETGDINRGDTFGIANP